MYVVGLTGGIGSGKSIASDYFASLGAHVVDADIVARDVVEPGQPALDFIAKKFGQEILLEDGGLNRQRLRNIIFENGDAKQWLEDLLHPIIRDEIVQKLNASTFAYSILVSPLLFETNQHKLCDRTLLIDAPESLQKQRASERDNTSPDAIQKIIDTQLSREEKSKRADDILINDGTIDALKEKIAKQHAYYLAISTHS